jgi:hypothetical protein
VAGDEWEGAAIHQRRMEMNRQQTILSHLLRGESIDRDAASSLYGIKGLSGVISALRCNGVEIHGRLVRINGRMCCEYALKKKMPPRKWGNSLTAHGHKTEEG